MFKKTLTQTLSKVANFVKDLEDGIELNNQANDVLQAQVDIIETQKTANTVEISMARNMLQKLK